MDNRTPENIFGILGPSVGAPATFPKLREHLWLNTTAPWPYSNNVPAIPNDAIDALGGNGPVYRRNVHEARELFRNGWRFYVASVRQTVTERYTVKSGIRKASGDQKRKLVAVSSRERERMRKLAETLASKVRHLEPTALSLPSIERLAGATTKRQLRIALYGDLPEPPTGSAGRPSKEWPDSFFEFAWLFGEECGATQSKASFERALVQICTLLPDDLKRPDLPACLRAPLTLSAVKDRLRGLFHGKTSTRAGRNLSKRRSSIVSAPNNQFRPSSAPQAKSRTLVIASAPSWAC